MDFFDGLTLMGGVALFLYGMNLMGEGLTQAAGSRLERILGRLTDSPLKAVLTGTVVTAVIQSSSAVTVTVVGLVNSGLMTLRQAVGVIMGANIGTTATAWLLSLGSIESDHFLVRLFMPMSLAPILAVIGVGIVFLSKNERRKRSAEIMLGFSVMMFGMDTMSTAVEPLRQVEAFRTLFIRFGGNPVLGMLGGLALTAVIQSSSASVGLLQALCATGVVGYHAAIPIILGQNIGTCVTALLSAVGTSANAKRAALVHLYFNLAGAFLFLGCFYALDGIVDFAFLGKEATQAGIAAIHSLFNLASTVFLLPCSEFLIRLACRTIPDQGESGRGKGIVSSGEKLG